MSFARGFQTGLSAVQQFKDLRDERLQREQLAELEARRQAQIDAQQAQAGLEQQAIQQGTPLASAVPVDPMRAQLGLGAEPVGQMSPVIPQQTQLGGQPVAMRFQQSADQLPMMSEQDYLREQARIYSSFGDNATAAGLRAEALGYDTRALEQQRYDDELGFKQREEQRTIDENKRLQKERQEAKQREKAITSFLDKVATGKASTADVAKYAADNNIPMQALLEQTQSYYNINEAQIATKQREIARTTAGMSLEQLFEYHKTNDSITPGRHYGLEENDKGVMLVEFNTETGEKVRDLQQFPSNMAAEDAVRKLANNYATAVESLVNTEAKRRVTAAEQAIEQAKIAVDKLKIDAGQRKQAAIEIGKLADDPVFMSMKPGEQQKYIAQNIYAPLGIDMTGGKPDVTDEPVGLFRDTTSRDKAAEAKAKRVAELYTPEALDRLSKGNIEETDLRRIANDPDAPQNFRDLARGYLDQLEYNRQIADKTRQRTTLRERGFNLGL